MQLSHGLMFHTELLIRLMMNFISNHWYFMQSLMRQSLQVMICLICTLIWVMILPDVEMYLRIILKRMDLCITQEEPGN